MMKRTKQSPMKWEVKRKRRITHAVPSQKLELAVQNLRG